MGPSGRPPDLRRHRPAVALCLAATVALGLASRRWPLPGVLAEHAGDGLYTVAAFWVMVAVVPAMRGRVAGLVAFAFSAAIEFCQLLQAEWLRELRANRWAALLLGQGFQVTDLVAYAVGAAGAVALDCCLFRRGREANP